MSSSTPSPGALGACTNPPSICSGFLVRRCPSCQIQCVSIAVTRPGAAAPTCVNIASDTSKSVVRVRAPGQARVAAGLGDAHGAGHGPEVRVRQRDVHRLQRQRVRELPPVGRDHVGRRRQSRRTAELRHHLAPREAVFGAAGVFGVGDDAVHVAHQADRVREQPAAVGVERDAAFGKRSCSALTASTSWSARSAPPLSLKSLNP